MTNTTVANDTFAGDLAVIDCLDEEEPYLWEINLNVDKTINLLWAGSALASVNFGISDDDF